MLVDVMQRRSDCLEEIARQKCDGHEVYGQWTFEEWKNYLQYRTLDKKAMENAVKKWKQDFLAEDFDQIEKVEEWLEEDTRQSKRFARNLQLYAVCCMLYAVCCVL